MKVVARILKVAGFAAAALVVLGGLVFAAAILVNLRDAPPSADYRHLVALVAERPPVTDADNGYVYLLGVGAAPGADPRELGARRLAWLEGLNRDMSALAHDPGAGASDYSAARSAPLAALREVCDSSEWARCRAAFDGFAPPAIWAATDQLELERYRELIRHPAWREHVANDVRQPFADYGHASRGQRLHLLALRGADAPTLRAGLSADLEFWRRVLASSDTLITKMISVSALRQHFRWGNLLLRAVPPAAGASAMPDAWRRPFTHDELSAERMLAGEIVQMEGMWRNRREIDRVRRWHISFYQPQDVCNVLAAEYRDLAAVSAVPLRDLRRAIGAWKASHPLHPFPSRLYDIGGDYLRGLAATTLERYPERVAAAEAWRRAALVTAELRARGVPAELVATELARTPLRDPFDDTPFAWSAGESAVIYEGDDDQSPARRRQVFTY